MSEDIHQVVRENYGRIAVAGGQCCAEGGSCITPQLYDVELLETLPDEVTELSLGCGDPVTIASLRPGESVLDLGSGGGIDCFLAAEQVGRSGQVIGVDMTPAMLERAEATRDRLGLDQVEFRYGQLEALPVDDETIDVILSNCVINLVPDKAAAFPASVSRAETWWAHLRQRYRHRRRILARAARRPQPMGRMRDGRCPALAISWRVASGGLYGGGGRQSGGRQRHRVSTRGYAADFQRAHHGR